MFLCVTLNPCLDRTLSVPAWSPGDNVRGTAVRAVVGGKGNNVARALKRLGSVARPVTFLGGPTGERCERLLRDDDGFDPLVIPSKAETRTILTVRTRPGDDQSAFFDPDPAVTDAEAKALLDAVAAALNDPAVQALTLSGSSPSPATHGVFRDLIALARPRSVPVLLDTYGPALRSVGGTWPDVIQLNRREASTHLNKPDPSPGDLDALADGWCSAGVSCVVITDGPNAGYARLGAARYRVTPPEVRPVNPIGSGDSLLAGLADGWVRGLPPEDLLRHGFCCAVANALAWDAGAVDPAEAAHQAKQVVVERSVD